ncbi:putative membrane protein [Kurthia huakuii]|uniref:hypothetical protein n=1 Tax=Kurthia huakuii TaxID=1421019 RepID=UPI000494F18B|nr:hypothetical protein [Kurthia huakuii]MBM7700399.1 putative membrane protein [Kurthia huakuii]
MFVNIIGISSILVLVVMILLNASLSKIIITLFISSVLLFLARVFLENSSILNALTASFGILSIVGFIYVWIHFLKHKNS